MGRKGVLKTWGMAGVEGLIWVWSVPCKEKKELRGDDLTKKNPIVSFLLSLRAANLYLSMLGKCCLSSSLVRDD